MSKISVCIPSRGPNPKLHDLLKDLEEQTLKPDEVIVLVDNDGELPKFDLNIKKELSTLNVAGKRNELIKMASWDLVLLVDDDNRLPQKDRLEKLVDYYQKIQAQTDKPIIIAPYSRHRKKGQIQAAWLKFSYLLSKMSDIKTPPQDFRRSWALGGVAIFGSKEALSSSEYDMDMGFLREDVDFDRTFVDRWWELYTVNLPILHMERLKNIAQKGGYSDLQSLKRKIKNRNLFVQKHANNLEKLQFYLVGYWLMPLGALIKLLISKFWQKTS